MVFDTVDRYLRHCAPDDADRRALAAIAMADDAEILRAMLEPELPENTTYESRMKALWKRHAAIQIDGANGHRLHDHAADFFTQRLMGPQRHEKWVKTFAKRGVKVCRERMKKQDRLATRLSDLCEDADYCKATATALHLLHWIDEAAAEQLFAARLTEGMGHNPDLVTAVIEVADAWAPRSTDATRRRREKIKQAAGRRTSYMHGERQRHLASVIDDYAKLGWLSGWPDADRWAEERHAIRHRIAAQALRLTDELPDALKRLREAVTALRSTEEAAVTRSEIREEAEQLSAAFFFDKSDYPSQRDAAVLAVEADDQSASAQHYLGIGFANVGEFEKALEPLLKALEIDKSDANIWRVIGDVYSSLKDHQKALEHHLRALEIDDSDANNWRSIGDSYSWLGDDKKALVNHQKALEIDDGDANNWRSVGNSYSWLGDDKKALEHHQKALEIDDSDANNWRSVGSSYTYHGDLTNALKHLTEAIDRRGDNAKCHASLANALRLARRYPEARMTANAALTIDDQNDQALSTIAYTDLYEGKPQSIAREHLLNANIVNQNWNAIALTDGATDDWSSAADAFAQGCRVFPEASYRTGEWAARRQLEPDWNPEPEAIEEVRRIAERTVLQFDAALLAAFEGHEDTALALLKEAIEQLPCYADEARFRPEFIHLRSSPEFQALTAPL